ncbi:isoprenoid synthase domain-containing protein [Schizothecium vesticola]|uniref:Terpene synthase n=1 Tax=Schizothecium vesticola TaxID=314040 RepID=A0AA40EUD6_9PEZI|nr:isoprenoid synthase domain-containing protein [Schizothecium vesticola]
MNLCFVFDEKSDFSDDTKPAAKQTASWTPSTTRTGRAHYENRHAPLLETVHLYFDLRRETISTLPSFALIELHINIPDQVMSHPPVQRMPDLCANMVSMGNDLYSYNAERSRDDEDHNFVTAVMQELGLSVQDAFEWIDKYHDSVATEFLALYEDLPVFSEETEDVNREIREYVDGLEN